VKPGRVDLSFSSVSTITARVELDKPGLLDLVRQAFEDAPGWSLVGEDLEGTGLVRFTARRDEPLPELLTPGSIESLRSLLEALRRDDDGELVQEDEDETGDT
jgi:hypothetical protein